MADDGLHEVAIIGGGPAGYTAALYAARGDLSPVVIEGYAAGGQLMITSEVDNYPGFKDGIMGPALMQEMRAQCERFGADIRTEDVTAVRFSDDPLATPHELAELTWFAGSGREVEGALACARHGRTRGARTGWSTHDM